jgi:methyl-accepting chemotaxis protein
VQELATVLNEAADKARQISGATVQQAAGMRQINDAMASVSQGGQDNATAARQLEQALEGLVGVGNQLRNLITG